MIIKEKQSEAKTSGIGGTSHFRIKTSAKAFQILSGGIYSDPELAIVSKSS